MGGFPVRMGSSIGDREEAIEVMALSQDPWLRACSAYAMGEMRLTRFAQTLDQWATDGDPREALGTLWYHDHCMDFTAANVVRGMAGFHLMYDELDSNDENDTNPAALRLPSGEFDMPLIFQDFRIDPNTYQVVFDQLSPEGVVGDKIPVNGIIEPFMKVARRKYRLRLLNGGPSPTSKCS